MILSKQRAVIIEKGQMSSKGHVCLGQPQEESRDEAKLRHTGTGYLKTYSKFNLKCRKQKIS